MHIEAGKSLESTGRAEEASLKFRAKDSLNEGIDGQDGVRNYNSRDRLQ